MDAQIVMNEREDAEESEDLVTFTQVDEVLVDSQEANNRGELDGVNGFSEDSKTAASSSLGAHERIPDSLDFHGQRRLHGACQAYIETVEFSRLDDLKQLGAAFYVFPAARHTRSIHSKGVSHLALRMVEGLVTRSREKLGLTERDIRNVALAGLFHDLGHGLFSHVFEKEVLTRVPNQIKWEHEEMSIKMIRHMVAGKPGSDLTEEDIQFMKKLIHGVKADEWQTLPAGKRFLYDIISNDRNGVDVDRMDYLMRDALYTGAGPLACNIGNLLDTAEVVDDEICYPLSQATNVWLVFAERVRMFQQVYTHPRVKAAEFMVAEALVEANKATVFLGKTDITEAKGFLHVADSFLWYIQNFQMCSGSDFDKLTAGQKASLAKAQALLRRLDTMDHYVCVAACDVPEAMLQDGRWEGPKETRSERFTAAEVVSCGEEVAGGGNRRQLSAADLILDLNKIEYAKGRDPMTSVKFFDDSDGAPLKPDGRREKLLLTPEQLALLPNRPSCFKIRTLRVFVRQEEHRAAAVAAFRAWCSKVFESDDGVRTEEPETQRGPTALTATASACTPALPAIGSPLATKTLPFAVTTCGYLNAAAAAAVVCSDSLFAGPQPNVEEALATPGQAPPTKRPRTTSP